MMKRAILAIRKEADEQVKAFEKDNKLIEAQRLRMRTTYDIEMMRQVGSCSGIENYSRHIDGREAGTAPHCLLDYFPDDFLLVIDESHVTVPQIGSMYEGDMSRKRTLVEHGFRLPSAMDNRPLKWDEFLERIGAYTVDAARSEKFPSVGVINGWRTMPVTFTPGTGALAGTPTQSSGPVPSRSACVRSRRLPHPAPVHVDSPRAVLQHVRRNGSGQRLARHRDRLGHAAGAGGDRARRQRPAGRTARLARAGDRPARRRQAQPRGRHRRCQRHRGGRRPGTPPAPRSRCPGCPAAER